MLSWDTNGERLTVEYTSRKLAELRDCMAKMRPLRESQVYRDLRPVLVQAAMDYRRALRDRPWG